LNEQVHKALHCWKPKQH